jgi:hypothetical protein
MERRVMQPGAAQIRNSFLIGEGDGILPGRLPFMDPVSCERLLRKGLSLSLLEAPQEGPIAFAA